MSGIAWSPWPHGDVWGQRDVFTPGRAAIELQGAGGVEWWRSGRCAVDHFFLVQLWLWRDYLGGGFKYFLFSTLPGEMIHFD